MKTWLRPIKRTGACQEAIDWGEQYDSLDDAWLNCERGDWMLWLAGRLSGEVGSASRKKLVLAACECARLTLPHVKKGELRPLRAIETAEKWARGEGNITLTDVRAAANAAYAAYAADAADAAYAAAYAANAAYAAAHAANAANAAAYAAAYAANAANAAYTAAHAATLKQCADIVRKHFPTAPIK